ncbi:MAG: TPM domain-containing protein [Fulvivirga sp.]
MKKLFLISLLLVSLVSQAQLQVPYLSGRVVDEAGVLSEGTIQQLETSLKAHEDSTSNQIVVLTISSLEDEILEEYSLKVAETWAIGQKGIDNGVLLLIAIEDRKMRVEVGYGLEGDLTDALANRIIRNEIAPNFRQGDYDQGITEGVNAIINAISGSYDPEYVETYEEDEIALFGGVGGIPWYVSLLAGGVFLLVVGTFTFFAFMTKGCASWFLFLFLLPFYATFPLFLFGIVPAGVLILLYFFGFLYFKIFYIRSGSGKKWFDAASTKLASSSGSGSGSGWSSSSSSSFSGGGGSFGGGGSSGSW